MPKNSDHNELENIEMKKNIFQVPEGYFEALHNNILSKVEDESEFSVLNNEKLKENIFKVPAGYFELSQKLIEKKINGNGETKIIPLYKRNWIRYAAASVALVAVFVFGLNSDDGISSFEYAGISDEVIIEYLLDEGISNLDILASLDDEVTILGEFLDYEIGLLEYSDFDNPEMEYDFEYIDY